MTIYFNSVKFKLYLNLRKKHGTVNAHANENVTIVVSAVHKKEPCELHIGQYMEGEKSEASEGTERASLLNYMSNTREF